jgi:hypothetical protein
MDSFLRKRHLFPVNTNSTTQTPTPTEDIKTDPTTTIPTTIPIPTLTIIPFTIIVFSLLFLIVFSLRCALFDRSTAMTIADPYSARFLATDEPIDVVYTWVNGSDPEFLSQLEYYRNEGKILNSSAAGSRRRFADNQELKYSLRSLEKYAPWIRNIYIVTNGQVPNWLRVDHPRLKIITHHEIYSLGDSVDHLPTFSSPSIETHIHRIPNLSRRFLYFNDDVFLGTRVHPEDFISRSGTQKIYLSWEMPDCAIGCHDSFIGDKYCDLPCNNTACNFDGGDCIGVKKKSIYDEDDDDNDNSTSGSWNNNKKKLDSTDKIIRKYDTCEPGCNVLWIGDGICDSGCRNAKCGFDGADCPRDAKVPGSMPVFRWVKPTATTPSNLNKTILPTFHTTSSKVHSYNGWYSFLVNVSGLLIPPGKDTKITRVTIIKKNNMANDVVVNNNSTITAANQMILLDTSWIKSAVQVNKWGSSILFVTRPQINMNISYLVETSISYDALIQEEDLLHSNNNNPPLPPSDNDEDEDDNEHEQHDNSQKKPNTKQSSRIGSFKTSFTFIFRVDGNLSSPSHTNKLKSNRKLLLSNTTQTLHNNTTSNTNNKNIKKLSNSKKKSSKKTFMNDDGYSSSSSSDMDDNNSYGDDNDVGEDFGPSLSSDSYKDLNSDEPDEEGADAATKKWKKKFDSTKPPTKKDEEDIFGLSLLSTKAALRALFPKRIELNTKVPAHMPHLIDTRLIYKLHKALPDFYKKTSASRFRGKDNAQFSYAYATYLMADDELERVSEFRSFFSEFIDVDRSGCIETSTELRTLIAMIMSVDDKYVLPTTKPPSPTMASALDDDDYLGTSWAKKTVLDNDMIERARQRIWADSLSSASTTTSSSTNSGSSTSATTTTTTNTNNGNNGIMSKTINNVLAKFHDDCLSVLIIEKSPKAFSALLRVAMENRKRTTPRYELAETANQVTFIMLRDNSSDFLPSLDSARVKRTKFVCINDDTSIFNEESEIALREFFLSMFPQPSEFEIATVAITPHNNNIATSSSSSSSPLTGEKNPTESTNIKISSSFIMSREVINRFLLNLVTIIFIVSGIVLIWQRKRLIRLIFISASTKKSRPLKVSV